MTRNEAFKKLLDTLTTPEQCDALVDYISACGNDLIKEVIKNGK